MNAKFTPGPWKAVATIGGWDGVEADGHLVCKLVLNNPPNADLIAAAPDLVEALKGIVEACFDGDECSLSDLRLSDAYACRAALAKAGVKS